MNVPEVQNIKSKCSKRTLRILKVNGKQITPETGRRWICIFVSGLPTEMIALYCVEKKITFFLPYLYDKGSKLRQLFYGYLFCRVSQEEEKLLANCPDHLYPIVLTALNTGMRKSELLNLQWTDVDFDRREIAIRSHYDWHTKNYDYRYVGINDKLLSVLSNLPRNGEYVFTYAGKPIKDIKRAIATAYKEAGIDHQGQPLHILRHTFATRLIQEGVELEKIQQLLGHQDFSTTLQYAHLTSRSVKDEVNKL